MEAIQLRLPYWDWASDAVPPKEVILDKTVEIITPETEIAGHKTTTSMVPNPFLSFTFPKSIDLSILGPNFIKWRTTLRHPFPVDSPQAKSDVKDLVRLVSLLYAISTMLMIIINFISRMENNSVLYRQAERILRTRSSICSNWTLGIILAIISVKAGKRGTLTTKTKTTKATTIALTVWRPSTTLFICKHPVKGSFTALTTSGT